LPGFAVGAAGTRIANNHEEVEMEPQDQDDGNLKKKVATGVAVGLATTAAAGVAKKLLDSGDDEAEKAEQRGQERQAQARSTTRTRSSSPQKRSSARRRTPSKTRAKARATSATATAKRSAPAAKRSPSGNSREQTKEQLYAQAKRLKIEGRSTMTKAQLKRAVARAK
jgi:hypothetical protein